MTSSSPKRATSRSRSLKYILMLGALAALPAVTTDMYLPALPEVAADLATTTTAAQFTLSGTLLGTAVGQLVIGPLSDRFGRRLPLLIGISMHIVTSLLCAIAPNIGLLIGLRVLQGFFNAAASVVAIAVIRDRFTGSDAAKLLSRLMLMIGLAPLLAPTLGQAVAGIWAWRAVFYALALIGVILVIIVWRWMPETLPPERRLSRAKKGSPKTGEPGGYRILLRDRRFLAYAVIPGLAMGVIMSYVVGSPFVMQEEYGLTPGQFALIFAVNGVAMVISSQINASMLSRASSSGILRIAAPILLVLALALPVIIITGAGGVFGLVAGLWLVLGMQGFIFANATSLALDGYGRMAGTAAALLGCLQVGLAGLISPLVGVFGGSALSMAGVIIGCAVAMVLVLASTPAYRRGNGRNGSGDGRLNRRLGTGQANAGQDSAGQDDIAEAGQA
ncbi:multidrug effflux MFS transporter [Arthrobacter luteolus]|uniref:multidrug effflux MFS transporter n=1 Tax=Arthrobacter luteolus TaxID=98672 RepID=UPI000A445A7B|nr:multidrug effflux MFS transporter [Arthrobacter luteolus]